MPEKKPLPSKRSEPTPTIDKYYDEMLFNYFVDDEGRQEISEILHSLPDGLWVVLYLSHTGGEPLFRTGNPPTRYFTAISKVAHD